MRLRAVKASGGVVEILVERLLAHLALTQLRASHAPEARNPAEHHRSGRRPGRGGGQRA